MVGLELIHFGHKTDEMLSLRVEGMYPYLRVRPSITFSVAVTLRLARA
jgi:hypothetical protein